MYHKKLDDKREETDKGGDQTTNRGRGLMREKNSKMKKK